jgi:hypothetical protein
MSIILEEANESNSNIGNINCFWRTPKLLVRLKMSLRMSNNGIIWSSEHTPSSQH